MKLTPSYKSYSDEELVALLRESDPLAFSEIFSRYRAFLLLYTFRRIHDVEHAKDLINDAFTIIWTKRETIHIQESLRPFLVTIIKNKILDHYKHQKISQQYLDNFQVYLEKYENKTDHLVRENDLSAKIDQEVALLPEKMRVVFELSRKSHMNRKEIADQLGIPQETVNSRMRHALKILKSKFGMIIFLALIFTHNQYVNIILTFF